MSLSEILERVQPWCPGWEIKAGRKNLLSVAQQCLDRIFAIDHESLVFRPGNTGGNNGFQPYLLTTTGTYKYPIIAANLSCGATIYHVSSGNTVQFIPRKIRRITVDISNVGYSSDEFYGRQYDNPAYDPFNFYGLPSSRVNFVEIKVSTTPAMVANSGTFIPPTVTFQSDPGTTTTKFFAEFYIGPKRLTSENDEIPLAYQFEQDMEDYIRGRVQELESGVPSPMMEKFMNVSLPEIRSEFLTTTTVRNTRTPPNYV